jgi:MFS transporter, ACS family, hexuronate transporter
VPAGELLPPGAWRPPFVVIGILGSLWAVPWLVLMRDRDLVRTPAPEIGREPTAPLDRASLARLFAVLVVVVVTINLTWQFFRAWLPQFLEENRGYSKQEVAWFISAYYIAADGGCLAVGAAVKWLAGRGWDVHRSRMLTFAVCTGLTLLAVPVIRLPAGPLLVCLLLLIAAGTLGFFPNYYSFTQELTRTHQGKIAGALGTIGWISSSIMQKLVGENIAATHSYTAGILMAAVVPGLALLALLLFWRRPTDKAPLAG